MSSGFRSRYVSDALIRRQTYIEGVKTALHDEYDAVALAAFSALAEALRTLDGRLFSSISKRELNFIISKVTKAYAVAGSSYSTYLTSWLKQYVTDEALFVSSVFNTSITDAHEDPGDVWPFVAGTIIAATGLTFSETIKELLAKQKDGIKKLIQRGFIQKWTADQLLQAFKGTASLKRKDGLLTKLKRATNATVDTIVQFGASSARLKVMQKYISWTLGYTWVSILDSRTSQTCRSLSGKVFEYGKGPIPPIHFRCRSHVEPVFITNSVLTAMADSSVRTGQSYYSWLATQSASFQDEVLGKTRGILFRKGGLSAEEFADKVINARYEPLTLEQLRKKYPKLFAKANV